MTDKDRLDQRPLAKPTVQVENDRVIVTEWRFPPGGHTGWHKHMHDYVVVPGTTGELHIFDGKQTVPAPLRAGVSYARQTGVEQPRERRGHEADERDLVLLQRVQHPIGLEALVYDGSRHVDRGPQQDRQAGHVRYRQRAQPALTRV